MDVETLADMKAYLEEEIEKRKEELERMKRFLSIVDELLMQESFKTAAEVAEVMEKEEEEKEVFQILSKDGELLGEMFISENMITIKPNPDYDFSIRAPPFASFFVGKILTGMAAADEELVKEKKLDEKKALKFKVKAPNDILEEVVIRNYGDQKRVDEIKNTIRWTLEKIYEQESKRPRK
ncbi:MAG: hypothetical protein ACTSSA_02910 [Candidatus Freyarchaeota archaeon]|nr:hypothetical protein [Candidatus Freyarchaeota archaeon]MDO8091099.1 hypothetical protein [Candidatus Sigynarchaeota archaeon]